MAKNKPKKQRPEADPSPAPPAAPPAALPLDSDEPVAAGGLDPDPGAVAAPSRRDFLALSANLLVGLGGLGALGASVRLALPDFRVGPPERFALGRLADFKMHSLTWLRDVDLFVLHDAGGFGAFSARCTHLGCIVQRTTGGFVCPCHGARFDPAGRVLSGPARDPLPWHRVWIEPNGRLWVDVGRVQAAGTRSWHQLEAGS